MTGNKLSINFIIKDLGLNGGTKDIIIIANGLKRLGHEVRIIYPKYWWPSIFNADYKDMPIYIASNILRTVRFLTGHARSSSKEYQEFVKIEAELLQVKRLDKAHVPEADINFATWWETAEYVRRLPGKKAYLIQHYEVWGGRKSSVDKTYRMGFVNIVHSNWLKSTLESKTRAEISAVIIHAPDHVLFKKDRKIKKYSDEMAEMDMDRVRVMMLYRQESWKGCREAAVALSDLCAEHKHIEPVSIGLDGFVTPERLAEEYAKADIFIFPSLAEGLGLPPMEAMACGTAVVSAEVGAVPDYARPGQNMLTFKPGDFETMKKHILTLANNKQLRQEIAENGYQTMKNITWDRSIKQIEKVLINE